MNVVYKYKIERFNETILNIPFNAKVLHVDCVDDERYIWVLLNTDEPTIKRKFVALGTCWDLGDISHLIHIGTCLQRNGIYVWHIFEVV